MDRKCKQKTTFDNNYILTALILLRESSPYFTGLNGNLKLD